MTDITTVWDPDQGVGDWVIGSGDLLSGLDLQTAIYISLFSDRKARDDDNYDGTDRKGWWGDTDSDYEIGSRLWLLRRQKLSVNVAQQAVTYAKEALQWLLDDNVVASITVTPQIIYPSRLYMTITYQKPNLTTETVQYYWVWE
ncbi:phage GP46 family protein (plasmid) [Rouxiella badensis]|uniref:Phage tail protein n=1 Tax=Rouxiella badensis TaxID=1646377 RepID=A0A1X0WB73_9GAMM|nr:phage GP46 family protein [Rouxiella badensis]ORJ23965.1 hypothetical protein BS640_18870 [Rouxiella badensis]WAT03214.1 phage GP46 family protein [Rouxiella badensis]WAT03235.1 phage GP46 family protein [Rouxiella badensis]WAT03245.1 phage GP46 family protein [Rouxiella badensis]WAT03265.1 phage GP46 family protein [Rouxiella badensis]